MALILQLTLSPGSVGNKCRPGHMEDAVMDNQSATELRIGEGPRPPLDDIDLVLEGERLFGEGLQAEAKELFQRAVESCPGNVQAWNNLAVACMTEGDGVGAKNCLRQAIELKPDFLEARYNLA